MISTISDPFAFRPQPFSLASTVGCYPAAQRLPLFNPTTAASQGPGSERKSSSAVYAELLAGSQPTHHEVELAPPDMTNLHRKAPRDAPLPFSNSPRRPLAGTGAAFIRLPPPVARSPHAILDVTQEPTFGCCAADQSHEESLSCTQSPSWQASPGQAAHSHGSTEAPPSLAEAGESCSALMQPHGLSTQDWPELGKAPRDHFDRPVARVPALHNGHEQDGSLVVPCRHQSAPLGFEEGHVAPAHYYNHQSPAPMQHQPSPHLWTEAEHHHPAQPVSAGGHRLIHPLHHAASSSRTPSPGTHGHHGAPGEASSHQHASYTVHQPQSPPPHTRDSVALHSGYVDPREGDNPFVRQMLPGQAHRPAPPQRRSSFNSEEDLDFSGEDDASSDLILRKPSKSASDSGKAAKTLHATRTHSPAPLPPPPFPLSFPGGLHELDDHYASRGLTVPGNHPGDMQTIAQQTNYSDGQLPSSRRSLLPKRASAIIPGLSSQRKEGPQNSQRHSQHSRHNHLTHQDAQLALAAMELHRDHGHPQDHHSQQPVPTAAPSQLHRHPPPDIAVQHPPTASPSMHHHTTAPHVHPTAVAPRDLNVEECMSNPPSEQEAPAVFGTPPTAHHRAHGQSAPPASAAAAATPAPASRGLVVEQPCTPQTPAFAAPTSRGIEIEDMVSDAPGPPSAQPSPVSFAGMEVEEAPSAVAGDLARTALRSQLAFHQASSVAMDLGPPTPWDDEPDLSASIHPIPRPASEGGSPQNSALPYQGGNLPPTVSEDGAATFDEDTLSQRTPCTGTAENSLGYGSGEGTPGLRPRSVSGSSSAFATSRRQSTAVRVAYAESGPSSHTSTSPDLQALGAVAVTNSSYPSNMTSPATEPQYSGGPGGSVQSAQSVGHGGHATVSFGGSEVSAIPASPSLEDGDFDDGEDDLEDEEEEWDYEDEEEEWEEEDIEEEEVVADAAIGMEVHRKPPPQQA
mmetsp:Transcript_18905/g.43960  ORF Transcript_18905/g.43960 Transcript_18905/m.43960 type:complete len:965 (-) Transcript_18905:91-2985(-)